MKCKGEFIYKCLEKRSAGEFTNDKGMPIKYDEAYVVKVDEQTENGIMERKFKFPTTNKELIRGLQELQPYTRIFLEFNISLYNNQVRLLPIGLVEGE